MTAGHVSFRITLSSLARFLMLAGQLVLLAVTGTEGVRGPSTASHVERYGVDQHYAHFEATCVACTVLSLHARGEASQIPISLPTALFGDPPVTALAAVIVRRDTKENPSRAPPLLG
jgi:hypothetical protein